MIIGEYAHCLMRCLNEGAGDIHCNYLESEEKYEKNCKTIISNASFSGDGADDPADGGVC